jgi:hypothetical protein
MVTVFWWPPRRKVTLADDAESEKSATAGAFTVSERLVVWVSVPETPVTVNVTVPVAAVLLAVRVSVLVEVALAGLKLAVTPEGSPLTDRFTDPEKPFTGFTVMVLLPLFPWAMVKEVGESESEKSGTGAAFTVSERVVVWVSVPDTPVTVNVTVPVAAVLLAVRVSVLVEVVLAGLKLAVTPEGSPLTDRLTDPEKPFTGFTVTVLVPLFPWVMVKEVGESESEKSGAGAAFTVRLRVVV